MNGNAVAMDGIELQKYYLRVDIRQLEQRIALEQSDLESLRADLAQFDPPADDLVLEQLPDGSSAWLRPAPAETDVVMITDAGRRAMRMAELFGPAPTVAEVCGGRTNG